MDSCLSCSVITETQSGCIITQSVQSQVCSSKNISTSLVLFDDFLRKRDSKVQSRRLTGSCCLYLAAKPSLGRTNLGPMLDNPSGLFS